MAQAPDWFGESSLDFEVRFWTAGFDHWRIIASEAAISVSEALKEAEIEIPLPQRDLHLRSMDPSFELSFVGTSPEKAA